MIRFGHCYLIFALTPLATAQEGTWSERFPAVAQRVAHLDRRLSAEDAVIRKRVLTELTYFRPRDSKIYPPFLRALLKDRQAEPAHAPLFRSTHGRQVTYGALLYQWTKLCQRLGLVDAAGASSIGIVSVDIINGFCTVGPLASPRVQNIVTPIADLMRRAWDLGVRDIALTQDAHPADAVEFGQRRLGVQRRSGDHRRPARPRSGDGAAEIGRGEQPRVARRAVRVDQRDRRRRPLDDRDHAAGTRRRPDGPGDRSGRRRRSAEGPGPAAHARNQVPRLRRGGTAHLCGSWDR